MDFICYLHESWKPLIRPASATRSWMDATPEAFAYRCLPLNIANAHGWEILTPAGFSAYWRGGSGSENTIVRSDPGMPPGAAPVSLFGQGTVTIHIQGLFRTPPGWNLFISGSPNWAKDGIAPLSGVVETDWSPYTFTMNWRFTRRNHWVRFEAGDPICFVFPLQRSALERMDPKLVPLSANAELAEQFAAWSRSRNEFQAMVSRNPPGASSDKWQKRYYRGIDMKDRPGVRDHRAKLRLKEFAPADAPASASASVEVDAQVLAGVLADVVAGLRRGDDHQGLAARIMELGMPKQMADKILEQAEAIR
jgi:hypothetical protein